jgi:hypothetical protein
MNENRRLPEKIMNEGFQNHMDVILSEAEHGCESERKPRMINFFRSAIKRLNEIYFDSTFDYFILYFVIKKKTPSGLSDIDSILFFCF